MISKQIKKIMLLQATRLDSDFQSMRTLLYIFSVRNAIKRKKDIFSLKIAKNNLLKHSSAKCCCCYCILLHTKFLKINSCDVLLL